MSTTGSVVIEDTTALTSVTGFPRLISVGGVYVTNTEDLVVLGGFGSLQTLFSLDISENQLLTQITAFGQLQDLEFGLKPCITTLYCLCATSPSCRRWSRA